MKTIFALLLILSSITAYAADPSTNLVITAIKSAASDVTVRRATQNGFIYIVFKLGGSCYIQNLTNINSIPQETTPLVPLVTTMYRNLSQDELQLCNMDPHWVVAQNCRGTTCYPTRPLKEVDSASGQLSSNQIGTVPVGTPCGAWRADTIAGQTKRSIQWQGLSGWANCELK